MTAFYNECDPFAAQWLRNLIDAGHIAPGVVDERSIVELDPEELRAYTQVHLFAGIAGWSHALRLAGWPDERPVWTGSCPCQPFSTAGAGRGTADERHLWPVMFELVAECAPPVVIGEQVASPAGLEWLASVSADLEGAGYAFAAADLCAAGVGAPHIRQRLFWVADGAGDGCGEEHPHSRGRSARDSAQGMPSGLDSGGDARGMGHADGQRLAGERVQLFAGRQVDAVPQVDGDGECSGLGDPNGASAGRNGRAVPQAQAASSSKRKQARHFSHGHGNASEPCGPWSRPDWVLCDDPGGPRWRPVEPKLEPLAHGVPGRVGRLRAYGNAIVPQVAAEFIGAFMEAAQ